MDEKTSKHFFDALQACEKITRFVGEKTCSDYESDEYLQSAVERQFRILGEELNRLKKTNEPMTLNIDGFREAISLRNILAHGYDSVDHVVVWGIIEHDLPKLKISLQNILAQH